MLDLMSSIIMEGDGVTQELLDSILINLIPAHKNLNKQAFDLSKVLLKRTVQTIETCIANFFNQVLVLGKSSVSDLSEHVFDLIQELFAIDPPLLLSVMPQLEFKLKSNDGEERLAVVRLLAKLFGAKDSELATQNRPLWQCFLGRFNDIHVPVRLECVKFASHCLMNHPDLAKDLTEFLKVRSHDPEEAIRHDVIVTIITAGKKDLCLVNDQLLGFVRERTLDKRWRVRKEAMMGLAQLHKKYCLHHEAGKDAAQKVSWIKDKLLHIYYQNSIDDKLLVEKIFAQYMVPHNLETEEKMKCLYYLYACLDPNAVKALNEMWKCQNMLRSQVRELLDLHKQPTSEANSAAMFGKLMTIAKNLPDPGKAQDFMKKFNQVLGEDEKLRAQLELLINPTCSCKQAEVCVREITRKLANPKQPTNPFLEMVKFLLERIAPVHIDSEAISALVKLLNKSIEGTAEDEEEGVMPDAAIRSGLELLKPLSRSLNADVPEQLITPLVSLGHISMLAPDQFASPMKSIVANFIVKDLLMNDRSVGNKNGKLWCPDEEVSPEVLAKVHAIKLLVRWLLGMRNNQSKSANSTLRLLSAMLVSEGDLTEQKKISKSDMSRLRLAAGGAIMKLSQEPCYHEIITPEQFQLSALVINDECYQVRQIFAQKVHVALVKLQLPLEYMSIFSLCAKDPVKERRAHARQCLLKNISVRREYIKQNPMAHEKLLSLLPEYVVPYMIHLLAHDPDFTKPQDFEQLRDIKEIVILALMEDFINDKEYLSLEARTVLLTGKPKPASVLGTVNKPLSVTGKRPYNRTAGSETGSNVSGHSEPSSPSGNKGREQGTDASETGASENEENPVILLSVTPAKTEPVKNKEVNSEQSAAGNASAERGKKRAAPADGSENMHQSPEENQPDEVGAPVPPKPRRGRPPKSQTPGSTEKSSEAKTGGRGRKRAAPTPESPGELLEAANIKVPKQQKDTEAKKTPAQRQMDLQR
ncbi:Sister chromatid cohesion protein PDS5-like A [Acipenser ruthenus]|uniref:Sister chromatid cohesion protein PDS5-like A n=1 Tax=Acipenser ruthenus TaxID=7906 RepID=A0A444V2W1_ACIRT|nr:Sister chromatid cohesion protein PDS5-like A [Acipenser ruthenus]